MGTALNELAPKVGDNSGAQKMLGSTPFPGSETSGDDMLHRAVRIGIIATAVFLVSRRRQRK